jgi:hypothetical protein
MTIVAAAVRWAGLLTGRHRSGRSDMVRTCDELRPRVGVAQRLLTATLPSRVSRTSKGVRCGRRGFVKMMLFGR